MKPISIVLSPTRSRPLNVFLGVLLTLLALLLLLSLATWHAADPSLDTATDAALPHAVVHNWVGLFGAWLGDLLLQALGLTAFLLPLWLGGLGWTWMHSRPGGSAWLRWTGTLLALLFLPAVFGLLPWHWHWLHLLPVEGVVGRLISALLVGYINIQGAWLVAGALAAAGLYFSSAVSFWAVKESMQERWIHVVAWSDRYRNWREERAERKAEAMVQRADLETDEAEAAAARPHLLAGLFHRNRVREQYLDRNSINDVPAYQRAPMPAAEEAPAVVARRASIWERNETEAAAPQPGVPIQRPRSAGLIAVPTPIQPAVRPEPAAETALDFEAWDAPPPAPPARLEPQPVATAQRSRGPEPIAIHGRADAEVRTATVAPKNVSGFKLPPSTLLNAGEAPQAVKEDLLREEARTLVEKCGEFDVRGQVVQINTGPMVTTYEFKPEAGVKYSRVTGLADDLCLAMRAESILIERMAGKSTVGIQVPNHDRETIHLRDVLESEVFARSKGKLTIAMGKDINGRIVPADLATMPHLLIAGSTG